MVSGLPQQQAESHWSLVGSGGSLAVPWVEEGCQWLCRQKELNTSARLSWHGPALAWPPTGPCQTPRKGYVRAVGAKG